MTRAAAKRSTGRPDASVVIPCFNEVATLRTMTARVLAAATLTSKPLNLELIFVDDGSNDGSSEVLTELATRVNCELVPHSRNLGKGAALKSGIARATGRVIVLQDADLEYDPADIPALVAPILDQRADVVFGSRFARGGPRRVGRFWHTRGNQALTQLSNALSDLDLTDIACGYKAFRREVLASLDLVEDGFGIEAEITAKVATQNHSLRVHEVPTSYTPRTRAEGKKIRWRDGLVAARCVLRYNLWP